MKKSTIVVMVLLIIVSVAHLLRLVLQWKITINTIEIPVWLSVVACAATAALAIWLWSERK